jgi:hypothetical protein
MNAKDDGMQFNTFSKIEMTPLILFTLLFLYLSPFMTYHHSNHILNTSLIL